VNRSQRPRRVLRVFPLFLLAFLIITPPAATAQWIQGAAGTHDALWTVHFLTDSVGWIAYHDTVSRTTDGGATWSPHSVGTSSTLTAVFFCDLDTGYAAGARDPGVSAVFRTTDGGEQWQDVSPGVGTFMSGVYFVDGSRGWAVGQDGYPGKGRIVATTDAGETWAEQPAGPVRYLSSTFFVDSLNGWVVGDMVILKTTDGGSTWVEQDTALTHFWGLPLHSVCFANKDTGWVVGGIAGESVIASTRDGGSTWSNQLFGSATPSQDIGRLYWVTFVDDTTGWFVGTRRDGVTTLILNTKDGGQTLTYQDPQVRGRLFCVSFADDQHGWAVGELGLLLVTSSGGVTEVHHGKKPLPMGIALFQNYPNPFNPSTTIRYALPYHSHVTLAIFNALGQQVATLVQGEQQAGSHETTFDARGVASGVYLCRLQVRPLGSPAWRDSRNGGGEIVRTMEVVLVR
jgi:photosystem II stability/assembly factor-like uncharacterized protein